MKNIKSLLIAILIIAGAMVFALGIRNHTAKANNSRFQHTYFATSTTTQTTLTATSSVVSATSTLTFITNGADRVDVDLQVHASSTSLVMNWTYEYSDNGSDWYGEDTVLTQGTGNIAHATTTPTHTWTAGANWSSNSTTTKKTLLNIPVANADFMRINFTPSGSNATMWADVIEKIQEPGF